MFTIQTSAWRVPSVFSLLPGIYWQSQVSVAVAIDWTFTLGGVRTPIITAQVFFCVLNFHGWSRPQNYFSSEIFLVYGSVCLSISAYNDITNMSFRHLPIQIYRQSIEVIDLSGEVFFEEYRFFHFLVRSRSSSLKIVTCFHTALLEI